MTYRIVFNNKTSEIIDDCDSSIIPLDKESIKLKVDGKYKLYTDVMFIEPYYYDGRIYEW